MGIKVANDSANDIENNSEWISRFLGRSASNDVQYLCISVMYHTVHFQLSKFCPCLMTAINGLVYFYGMIMLISNLEHIVIQHLIQTSHLPDESFPEQRYTCYSFASHIDSIKSTADDVCAILQ